jgi:hypothetical protein
MVQINTDPAARPGWKEPHAARTGGEVQFMPYPDGPELHMLKRAVYIVEHNIYRKNEAATAAESDITV